MSHTAASVLVERVAGALVAVASNSLIAHSFGSRDYGALQVALSIVYIVGSLALVVSAQSVTPIFSRHSTNRNRIFFETLRLRVVVAIAIWGCLFTFSVITSNRLLSSLSFLLFCEPFAIAAIAAYTDARPWIVSAARIAGGGCRLALIFIAVGLGADINTVAFAWVIEGLVAVLVPYAIYAVVFKYSSSSSPRVRTLLLKRGLVMWPGVIVLLASQRIDRIILSSYLAPSELGTYAAAASLLEQWSSIGTMLATVVAAHSIYKIRSDTLAAGKALRMAATLGVLALAGAIGAYFVGGFVIEAIFGQAFAAATPILQVGAIGAIVLFVDAGLSTMLLHRGNSMAFLLKNVLTLVFILMAPMLTAPDLRVYSIVAAQVSAVLVFWITWAAIARWRAN